ncbi:Uncharacterized protein dnm_058680 [Desulfonema magnum]|uniref:Uncharacterized protein n=1 Tax=Desulfonema magnum TaxID=45655 RepID=A0A975BQK2_9BACT|nr:Uncharacterized protein dnm_058680 [Desulfonema magnum]
MLFRGRKNKIFALRILSELPESAALRTSPGRVNRTRPNRSLSLSKREPPPPFDKLRVRTGWGLSQGADRMGCLCWHVLRKFF